ncbi:MAG: L-seryl-tRNA(Sec) selenium transferase, partial [Candidatus Eremiobacteraeota bacterium]|nr:L-seryl-tRNA(Sec) selenium transferase [Candidatus Eremiobacteraeota bacterium]
LGGPQAGILAGRAPLVARLRSNPLLRALRVDKMTLAALGATLRLHRDSESRKQIPIYRILGASLEELRKRAQRYLSAVAGSELLESQAYVGGGALPETHVPSIAIALATDDPKERAANLRRGEPSIVARVNEGRLLFDLRTILPEQDAAVVAALRP